GRVVDPAPVHPPAPRGRGLRWRRPPGAPPPPPVRTVLVDGAWERFEAGDTDGYVRLVAAAADAVADVDADAIVLAQASMAAAGDLVTTRVPLLSSPRPGLTAGAQASHGA
ncbi:arylsulfatase, partial [Streptomyces sp. NPDC059378]